MKNILKKSREILTKTFFKGYYYLPFIDLGTKENDLGKLQKDESIFLFGLLKVLRPRIVVEFGFLQGYSAGIILEALDKEGRLYSYDNDSKTMHFAEALGKRRKNFSFKFKNQEDFSPSDIDNKQADFILMDASHSLESNKITFHKITRFMSPNAIIMIHDTGLWNKTYMLAEHYECLTSQKHNWLDNQFVAHQYEERLFVNWILEAHTEFSIIHFASNNVLRHGFTLIGFKYKLDV